MKAYKSPQVFLVCKMKTLKGTKNIKLLIEKEAGHRLSETHQLKKIIGIIQEVKKNI